MSGAGLRLIFTLDLDPTILRDGGSSAWIEPEWLLASAPAWIEVPPSKQDSPVSAKAGVAAEWVWKKGMIRYRKYPKGQGVRACRRRFCFPGCVPASLATAFHSLPWTYSVALDAPSFDEFRDYLASWTGLDDLVARGNPDRPDRIQPFFTLSIASHTPLREYNPLKPTGVHAHLCVGAVTWTELVTLLMTWKGNVSPNAVRKADHAWKMLHYAFSQHPREPESPGCPLHAARLPPSQEQSCTHPPG